MANHVEVVARILEGDVNVAGFPGHYSGREEAKGGRTGTGGKKKEQK